MNSAHSLHIARSLGLLLLAFLLNLQPLRAGSATWSANPGSGDWNTADNWTPNTIPDGTSDIATFGQSAVTTLSINTTDVALDSIVYAAGAPTYTINLDDTGAFVNLYLSGSGIVNNSGIRQALKANDYASINFYNFATAGQRTHFSGKGNHFITFHDSSSAASASFDVRDDSALYFSDNSTAANATITTDTKTSIYDAFVSFSGSSTAGNAVIQAINGGVVFFACNSTADHATVVCDSDGAPLAGGGINFQMSATAANGTFTAKGGTSGTYFTSSINFTDTCTAGDATFALDGGSAIGANGAPMFFYATSTAGNATITVNGGTNGGDGASVGFLNSAQGGTARIILRGNGILNTSYHDPSLISIGSIEGEGGVVLGARALVVGRNNLSTTFSGSIADGSIGTGGSFGKGGSGTLTVSGASTYTGGTLVRAGAFVVSNTTGSATGTGNVTVHGGTLGGGGTIAGGVTVGSGSNSGAILQPGFGTDQKVTLTVQGLLAFNADATYRFGLKSKQAEIAANGVTIISGAQFTITAPDRKLPAGQTATVISNTSPTPISGTFANLPDGGTISSGNNTYQASYEGGDGNDLTLTVE